MGSSFCQLSSAADRWAKEDTSDKAASLLDDASNSTLGVRARDSIHYTCIPWLIPMCILQFGKIFVISLPSRVDRRDAMVLAAAVSGLDIEFVDGVVGGDIDPKTINLVGEGHDLRQSELGIWRAHLNVYRKIVQQKITSALIMEVSIIHPRKLIYQPEKCWRSYIWHFSEANPLRENYLACA